MRRRAAAKRERAGDRGFRRAWLMALLAWAVLSGTSWASWKSGPTRPPARQGPAESTEPRIPSSFRPEERGVIRSNLSLLEVLTREAVEQAAESLNLAPQCSLTVVTTQANEGNSFVGNLMAQALAARGHVVQVLDLSPAPGTGGGNGAAGNGAGNHFGDGSGGLHQFGGGPAGGQPEGAPGKTPAAGDTTGAHADSLAAQVDPLWGKGAGGAQPAKENAKSGDAPAAQEGASGAQGDEAQTPSGGPAAQTPPAGEPTPSPSASSGGGPAGATGGRPVLPKGPVVDVRVLEFGITYADVGRVMLFGPLRFTRVGGVTLQVSQMLGPKGELDRVVIPERHQVDRLSGSERVLAEGASYPFTPPVLKPPSLGKYIEPTVVVAIVSSLVYLFYKNQN